MKLRRIFTVALVGFASVVFAQGQTQNNKQAANSSASSLQVGQAILNTEKSLDQTIFDLNQRMTRHTVLFKMKVSVLPFRTVLYKGKAEGDTCKLAADQTDPANNCMHLEVFDFVHEQSGVFSPRATGAKYKFMELFYKGQASNDPDPRSEPPRELEKIITRIYKNDFSMEEKVISEVIDRAPNGQPQHNENVEIFFQEGGLPPFGTPETPASKGVGKYLLSSVENTRTNHIRNDFKRDFYIKHLDYFDRLFTKLFDYNDGLGNEKYEDNVETLQNSLDY